MVAALGPVWLAPAGAAGAVVSSAMLPLSGAVGDVSLTGVVHVVTHVVVPPNPILPTVLTVYANLPAADVTFVGPPDGGPNLAQGAGRAMTNYDDTARPAPP